MLNTLLSIGFPENNTQCRLVSGEYSGIPRSLQTKLDFSDRILTGWGYNSTPKTP